MSSSVRLATTRTDLLLAEAVVETGGAGSIADLVATLINHGKVIRLLTSRHAVAVPPALRSVGRGRYGIVGCEAPTPTGNGASRYLHQA